MKTNSLKFRIITFVTAVAAVAAFTIGVAVNSAKAQYTGNENHAITLDQAATYIQNFRKNPSVPSLKGGYFGRNIFEKILAQHGCVGIRYYYAATNEGSPTIVLVGVDSTGNDMEQGVIGEIAIPCPPFCSSPNQLNK